MQVSSASSAAVCSRARVPQALTSHCPDDSPPDSSGSKDEVTPAFPYNEEEEQDVTWSMSDPPPGAAPHGAALGSQLQPYPSQEEGTATTADDIQPPPPAP